MGHLVAVGAIRPQQAVVGMVQLQHVLYRAGGSLLRCIDFVGLHRRSGEGCAVAPWD